MNLGNFNITFPFFTRDKAGDTFYDITALKEWSSFKGNLEVAQNHPILTPALLFVSKLFSQGKIKVIRTSTGEEFKNHYFSKVLKRPNFYQTLPDLLESLCFTQIANGVGVLYTKKTLGSDKVNSLYVLNYALIDFPDVFKDNYMKNSLVAEGMLEEEVVYDKKGANIKIKLKDLLFFYDLPNGLDRNPFKNRSRLDGLKQTLINTNDSLIAKNIILKTNGKEMLSGSKEGFPLAGEEKAEAEKLFNLDYGLSPSRKRGFITKANVTWKSLHIALRDLGLDESVKVDGNMIYTALHIPKDILSLEAKKTTYNNFKESMSSYIQNEMQSTLDSNLAVMEHILGDGFEFQGTYDHLPVMQFAVYEKYKGIKEQALSLLALRNAGLPDEEALERSGFNTRIQLNPISNGKAGEETTQTTTSTETEEEA